MGGKGRLPSREEGDGGAESWDPSGLGAAEAGFTGRDFAFRSPPAPLGPGGLGFPVGKEAPPRRVASGLSGTGGAEPHGADN